jgi:hypothetical protein
MQVVELRRALHINEVFHGGAAFVELYNSGNGPQPVVTLDDFFLVTGSGGSPDYASACDLTGAVMADKGFLVVQKSAAGCVGGASSCVKGCSFTLDPGDTVYLLKGDGAAAAWEVIDEEIYPAAPLPNLGETLQASPDGETPKYNLPGTPGLSNGG